MLSRLNFFFLVYLVIIVILLTNVLKVSKSKDLLENEKQWGFGLWGILKFIHWVISYICDKFKGCIKGHGPLSLPSRYETPVTLAQTRQVFNMNFLEVSLFTFGHSQCSFHSGKVWAPIFHHPTSCHDKSACIPCYFVHT